MTSAPKASKPITVSECEFDGDVLALKDYGTLGSGDAFLGALRRPGPWIAGIDFPFGQSRTFLENTSNADDWTHYVERFGRLDRSEWVRFLDDYKRDRPTGDKQHKRKVDAMAGGASPQTHSYTPVGLMFHFAAPLLVEADVRIPGLRESGDPERVVVEAYPGVLVRDGIGKVSYKNDMPAKQTPAHREARERIVAYLRSDDFRKTFDFTIDLQGHASKAVEDPTGDTIDGLLCAAQAAWAWNMRDRNFGYPPDFDRLEGWIPQPTLRRN
nr:DUF429 domain-containing protein [Jannaschia sp. LMIT008]